MRNFHFIESVALVSVRWILLLLAILPGSFLLGDQEFRRSNVSLRNLVNSSSHILLVKKAPVFTETQSVAYGSMPEQKYSYTIYSFIVLEVLYSSDNENPKRISVVSALTEDRLEQEKLLNLEKISESRIYETYASTISMWEQDKIIIFIRKSTASEKELFHRINYFFSYDDGFEGIKKRKEILGLIHRKKKLK